MALFVIGLISACIVGLSYLVAFLAHTIGPENWRWLSDVDKVRLTGEVRGFAWGLITVSLFGARVLWQKIMGKEEKDENHENHEKEEKE